jgi:tRNA(fMet)-specific endonuclease VapC
LSYLLDTNVCIAVINGTPQHVVDHFNVEARGGAGVFVSTVSNFELWYGIEKSQRREFNRIRLEIFLAGSVQLLPFVEEDSVRAGEVRARLERLGTPVGSFDTLIAGQALARGLVLVTHNVEEFGRVPGLRVEDWQR